MFTETITHRNLNRPVWFPKDRNTIPVTSIGEMARSALTPGSRWYVLAVFQRSFYCQNEKGLLICIGSFSIGAGPLNAVCTAADTINWEISGLWRGESGIYDGEIFRIGERLTFTFECVCDWKPKPLPQWDKNTLVQGLDALHETAANYRHTDGFNPLIWILTKDHSKRGGESAPKTPLIEIAWDGIQSLARWLKGGMSSHRTEMSLPSQKMDILIGLGSGLTPSGDDFLAGVMVALHAFGHPKMAQSLGQYIFAKANIRTHAISLAHLRCAARGVGGEQLHTILSILFTADTEALNRSLNAVDTIGHTSGWDLLAGVVMTCNAFLEANLYPN